eukprot:365303-Chlamydomonas_euryale.AAC.10
MFQCETAEKRVLHVPRMDNLLQHHWQQILQSSKQQRVQLCEDAQCLYQHILSLAWTSPGARRGAADV